VRNDFHLNDMSKFYALEIWGTGIMQKKSLEMHTIAPFLSPFFGSIALVA